MKAYYALTPDALPSVLCTDGTLAPELLLACLLTAHEKMDAPGRWPYADMEAAYQKPGVCADAASLLAVLDRQSLQQALLTLADRYLGKKGQSKKMYLAFPICRYADEPLMQELTQRAAKWRTYTSGNDAPPLKAFRDAAIYSQTHAAMLFADKFGDLPAYAALRDTDADSIRDRYLSDIGLDVSGKKAYDLGNQIVTVRLQPDFSLLVELPEGKSAKALPKKGADEQAYASAASDFSAMKKSAKQIVKRRAAVLFEDFLRGRGHDAAAWRANYLNNPLLRQIASLLVWTQNEATFTVSGAGLITADGAAYDMGSAEVIAAHPMEMTQTDVRAWQSYFASHGLKQPFVQIWEPVIDRATFSENRYAGCMIPFYRFAGQEKHGIYVQDEDYHAEISVSFRGCFAIVERVDMRRHEIKPDDRFEVARISFKTLNRQVNHILAYLDRVTAYDRVRRDDVSIEAFLPQFTPAQIEEMTKIAAENRCVNVTALLLEYRNKLQSEFDQPDAFSLELL